MDVTALQGPDTDTDTGFLTTSLNSGGPLDCADYTELLNDIVVIAYVGDARTKRVVETIDKRVMNATSNNGAAGLQVCYGAPVPFDTRPGTALLSENLDFVPGPYPAPEYKGLLPDCGKPAVAPTGRPSRRPSRRASCRATRPASGDGVIESLWPSEPTDPRSRIVGARRCYAAGVTPAAGSATMPSAARSRSRSSRPALVGAADPHERVERGGGLVAVLLGARLRERLVERGGGVRGAAEQAQRRAAHAEDQGAAAPRRSHSSASACASAASASPA